jgi:cyclase
MLFKRLIPKIVVEKTDSRDPLSFKTILTRAFEPFRVVGDPISQVKIQQSNLVDEILLVHRNRGLFDITFPDLVLRSCEYLNTPLTVGGAVTEPSHARRLFESGADKIVIGRARSNLALLESIVSNFGAQALVISIDYSDDDLKFGVDKFCENEISFGYLSLAGEIALNNIDRDGSGAGVDLRLVETLQGTTKAPIMVGCGVSSVGHIIDCFSAGCDAVTLSTFLSQTDQSTKQIRSHISTLGVHIRTRN